MDGEIDTSVFPLMLMASQSFTYNDNFAFQRWLAAGPISPSPPPSLYLFLCLSLSRTHAHTHPHAHILSLSLSLLTLSLSHPLPILSSHSISLSLSLSLSLCTNTHTLLKDNMIGYALWKFIDACVRYPVLKFWSPQGSEISKFKFFFDALKLNNKLGWGLKQLLKLKCKIWVTKLWASK